MNLSQREVQGSSPKSPLLGLIDQSGAGSGVASALIQDLERWFDMRLDALELMAEARAAARHAHAPYSGFAVGAVAVATDGAHFSGANVENAAFASTLCAEAVAIASAVAAGRSRVHTVAVASAASATCYPCGNCRQIMSEFDVHQLVVCADDGEIQVLQLIDLFPNAFGPELSRHG